MIMYIPLRYRHPCQTLLFLTTSLGLSAALAKLPLKRSELEKALLQSPAQKVTIH